jgi:hypothetical protein
MPGGTWRTMYEEVLLNAGRGSSDAIKAQLAICDAIDRHAAKGFFFAEREFRFDTVDGRAAYGDGAGLYGLLRVTGDELTLLVEGDEANPVQIPRLSIGELLTERSLQGGTGAQPEAWAYHDGAIQLVPTPDETVHIIRGHGRFSHGRLRRRHNGTTFIFYASDGVTQLTDNYPEGVEVNHWFDEGYSLIKCYAEYVLYAGQLHAQKGQVERLLTRYLEHYEALKSKTDQQSMPKFIRPWEP